MAPRKQKQKQRQSQKQSVVVNIHDKPKKRRARKKKASTEPLPPPPPVVLGLPKVPPIVVQYTDPASLVPPQPPRQEPVRQPEILAAPRVEPIMAEQRRENILQAVRRRERAASVAPIRRESEPLRDPFGFEIGEGEQRSPLRAEPIEPQRLFASSIRPTSDILQVDPNISFEDIVAGGERITRIPTQAGREQTAAAREVRQALQLSQRTGADVPIDDLIEGRYNLPGQVRRPQPTKDQRVRLYEAGRPYRGDEAGVKTSGKKKKVNV